MTDVKCIRGKRHYVVKKRSVGMTAEDEFQLTDAERDAAMKDGTLCGVCEDAILIFVSGFPKGSASCPKCDRDD